jgi:hypothetical protein
MRLHVFGAWQAAQVRHELFFVARGEQRRQEDDVGRPPAERGNGGVARINQDQFRADLFLDHGSEQGCLPEVGFNCEYEGHG